MENSTIVTALGTMPLLLTVRQLSEYLSISQTLAYRLLNTNQIRHLRLGKTIRIPREAVQEFLNSATV